VTSERPTSAQALADRACIDPVRLREHFRCQPAIIAISDRLCGYGLDVRTPPRTFAGRAPLLQRAHVLLPVAGEQARYLGSWRNDAEAARVVDVVAQLLDAGVPPAEIAVLTPYRGQLHALRRALAPVVGMSAVGRDAESAEEAGIALGTVHRFQGGERDVVVLSTTITEERSLPFLNEKVNLVNVAASRARVHLVVVGDPRVLARGRVTAALLPQPAPA
jgi:superfamily I DNA and/or RNA helicase